MTDLRVNELHYRLLQILKVDGVLGRGPRNDVVFVIVVSAKRGKLLRVRELDINAVLLHDALDAASTNADDSLVIRFGDVERDFRRQLLLKQGQTLQNRHIRSSNVDQEVVVVECFELDLHIGRLHYLVDFAILLAADEFPVFVGKLDLEANFVVEGLQGPRVARVRDRVERIRGVAYLDDIQLHDHVDSCPHLVLESMQFKAHALEDDFSS